MKIPVFHDDQHGTAIVAAAALLNGLEVVGKRIEEVKLVCSGAGAAAIACLDLAGRPGRAQGEHLGHRQQGRGLRGPHRVRWTTQKARYAQADLGPHAGRHHRRAPTCSSACRRRACSSPRWSRRMAERPLILALANPDPEIRPELAKEVRPDCIIATGRVDYPNQVNNVLCFPFIFRGALDVGATTINEEMKLACVARHRRARPGRRLGRGGRGLRPAGHPLRARLPDPAAVRPAPDHDRGAGGGRGGDGAAASRPGRSPTSRPTGAQLQRFVYTSGTVMQPVFAGGRGPGDQAHRLRRGRGRPGAARGPGGGRRAAWRGRSWSAGRR